MPALIDFPATRPSVECHALPCTIEFNRAAPVKDHFFPAAMHTGIELVCNLIAACHRGGKKSAQLFRVFTLFLPLQAGADNSVEEGTLRAHFRGRELNGMVCSWILWLPSEGVSQQSYETLPHLFHRETLPTAGGIYRNDSLTTGSTLSPKEL